MLYDVQDIEKYEKGKLIGGLIKYKEGDSWTELITDSYKTMFAYYYNYEIQNQKEVDIPITEEVLQKQKIIGINCGNFSYAEGPISFKNIFGVTGTLEILSDSQFQIMCSVYNIYSTSFAPSVYNIVPEKKREIDIIDGLMPEIVISSFD